MEQRGVSCLGCLIEVGVVSCNACIGEGGLWLVTSRADFLWGLGSSTLEVCVLGRCVLFAKSLSVSEVLLVT